MELKNSIKVKNLSCGYGKKCIVKDVSFEIGTGEMLCILGPNGIGKTTVFNSMLGFLPKIGGNILIGDKDISRMNRKEIAKNIAYVPQAHVPPFPFLVKDVVLMGRTVRFDNGYRPQKKDVKFVEDILFSLGVGDLISRVYTEVSGGERQMILIARALAQEPQFLVMDEPTSSLDFGNQVKVLERINILKDKGIGIIMTTHHPDHAFLSDAKVLLMMKGDKNKIGNCNDILTEENLNRTYGIDIKVEESLNKKGKMIKSCRIQI